MALALIVGLVGAGGAVTRYLVDGMVQDRTSGVFPFGTLAVNVAGSFILGLITGLLWYHHLPVRAETIVGTGFCGALTTWSAASWETVRLVEDGDYRQAAANAFGGIAAAVAAGALGIAVAAIT
jgi:CrcB protein